MFRFLPEPASEHAAKMDWLHNWITDLSVFFTVAIVGAMIYFAVRYRRRGGVDHETPRIEGSNLLEVIWTVVPTIVCIWIAYYGVVIYRDMVDIPVDEPVVEIYVKASKWKWDFEYENGKKTTNEFVLPVNKQAKIVLSSGDVLHSFFIPEMRVKNDAVPGMFTYVTFKPIRTGEFYTFCTEYCGKDHSAMLAKLKVVSETDYDRWVEDRSAEAALAALSPEKRGAVLYKEKGCNACHTLSDQKLIGPGFLKIFGQERKFSDGSTGKVDENYLQQSILKPNSQIVDGYPANQMPAFEDQLSDDEMLSLIAFIKSLDGTQPVEEVVEEEGDTEDLAALSAEERGKKLYETKLCVTCHSLDGTKLIGPTFQGLFGKKGKLADGAEYTADEAYLKDSIVNPMGKVVEGYPPSMPPGLLKEEEIPDFIEYLKTVE